MKNDIKIIIICEVVLKAVTSSNADLDMAQNIQKGRLFIQEKRIWMTKSIKRHGRACLKKNLARVMKNTSENPDSTINILAHSEETVDDKALQAITPSGHNGRGQVKAQTELAYAVSQA